MKLLVAIFCLLGSSLLGLCQNAPQQPTPATPEEVISNALTAHAFEGSMYKQIARMGDAAGVTLAKVLAEKQLDDIDIKMALVILRSSFADPSLVEIESDRQPRAALFVLRCLERDAADATTKKDVTETRKYLQQQFSTYMSHANNR